MNQRKLAVVFPMIEATCKLIPALRGTTDSYFIIAHNHTL